MVEERQRSVHLSLEPEESAPEEFEDDMRVTLHNDSEQEIEFNPHGWRIHRRESDGWTELEPTVAGNGRAVVKPGTTRARTLSEIIASIEPDGRFESGTYAVSITIDSADTTCIAPFRLRSE